MTVYRVSGFNGKQTAQVEARVEYDAKRYILEELSESDRDKILIDDLKVEKVFSHIKWGPKPK